MKNYLLLFILVLSGCVSSLKRPEPKTFTSQHCEKRYKELANREEHEQLDEVSDFFSKGCFHEVISLGSYLRSQFHDKFYKVTSEAAEIFTPEGTFTEYVMEDYERGYLTLLISLSYLHLKNEDAALVELRRTRDEKNARLYNYGDDRTLNVLLAALWDRFDTSISRPYWKRVATDKSSPIPVQKFAKQRILEIDARPYELIRWNITGFGQLPELDWKAQLFNVKEGPYRIEPKGPIIPACQNEKTLVVPTESWNEKIQARHAPGYHPLLYTKSLIRMPVGIGYGIIGATTGVVVGVGGCGLASYGGTSGGSNPICEYSLKAGYHIISRSTDVTSYMLKPDLRRWNKMPMAIVLSEEPPELTPKCNSASNHVEIYRTVQLVTN